MVGAIDRNFFIRAKNDRRCYCSKCGKSQLQDTYNYRRHGEECGFDEGDSLEPVKEGQDLGYRLTAEDEGLVLTIARPELVLRPGFTDRYGGGTWKEVFRMVFPAEGRRYRVIVNTTGIRADAWLDRFSVECPQGFLRIQREEDREVIRRVFPAAGDFCSLRMFAHIYSTRGFHSEERIDPAAAKQLIRLDQEKIRRELDEMRQMDPANRAPVYARLYRLKGTEERVLKVVLPVKDREEGFLFSGNCRFQAGTARWRDLLSLRCKAGPRSLDAIVRYAQFYPEYHLAEYMAGGSRKHCSNPLVPLLAPDYHSLMELAAKAALPAVAEKTDLRAYGSEPGAYRTLREAFGLPVSVLRKLGETEISDSNLEMLAALYQRKPSYLAFDRINGAMIRFIRDANLAGDQEHAWVRGIETLDDRQIRRILDFLRTGNFVYSVYRDYLNLCAESGEYPEGLTPGNVGEAHDRMLFDREMARNAEENRRFHQQVSDPAYQYLSTECGEPEEEESEEPAGAAEEQERPEDPFEEDEYVIVLPVSSRDLAEESRNMHNCVRTYTGAVSHGYTRIVFLRRKEEPDKSLGTIEVSPDNVLIQAKGFGNRHLKVKEQRFVRKWAKIKGILIRTSDLRESA